MHLNRTAQLDIQDSKVSFNGGYASSINLILSIIIINNEAKKTIFTHNAFNYKRSQHIPPRCFTTFHMFQTSSQRKCNSLNQAIILVACINSFSIDMISSKKQHLFQSYHSIFYTVGQLFMFVCLFVRVCMFVFCVLCDSYSFLLTQPSNAF